MYGLGSIFILYTYAFMLYPKLVNFRILSLQLYSTHVTFSAIDGSLTFSRKILFSKFRWWNFIVYRLFKRRFVRNLNVSSTFFHTFVIKYCLYPDVDATILKQIIFNRSTFFQKYVIAEVGHNGEGCGTLYLRLGAVREFLNRLDYVWLPTRNDQWSPLSHFLSCHP